MLFSLFALVGLLTAYYIVFHCWIKTWVWSKRWAWILFSLFFGKILLPNSKRNIYCIVSAKREDVTIWVAYLNAFQFIIMKMLFVYLFTILFRARALSVSLCLSIFRKKVKYLSLFYSGYHLDGAYNNVNKHIQTHTHRER